MAFQRKLNATEGDCRDINKRMIQQCANTLSRQQELSGPEVVSYLMGWGDRFISHNFMPIYWDEVTGALRRQFPELSKTNVIRRTAEHLGETAPPSSVEANHDPVVRLSLVEGSFELKDQLREYTDRGEALEDMNYYDYHVDTYDGAPIKRRRDDDNSGPEEGFEEPEGEGEDEPRRSGRPASKRVPYLRSAKRKGCRVIRGSKLETLPHFIGTWFPRRSNEEYYAANILALLKPWRDLSDLRAHDGTFQSAFVDFMQTASFRLTTIVHNIDYFHECSDGARRKKDAPLETYSGTLDLNDRIRSDIELDELNAMQIPMTEADVQIARNERYATREFIYGAGAMDVAFHLGIFHSDFAQLGGGVPCERASFDDTVKYKEWGEKITGMTKRAELITANALAAPVTEEGVEEALNVSRPPQYEAGIEQVETLEVAHTRTPTQAAALALLNREQRRAHDIIECHLRRTLAEVKQDQLLMIVRGEGGTGKTVLLNAIADTFEYLEASALLAKTATTGVAASLVGGMTVHGWAAIPVVSRDDPGWTDKAAAPNVERRKRNILPAKYVNIDECSMMTKQLLAQLSQVIGQVKASDGDGDPAHPFGNTNVILFGDFHQFPPVGDPTSALYSSKNKKTQSEIGMSIYHQFTTVVTLTEQIRITDLPWKSLLQRLRVGACTAQDLDILHSLVVTDPRSEPQNWNAHPWDSAVLVTPWHAARVRWNTVSVIKHCRRSGQRMYICNAEDTVGRNEEKLNLGQRVVVAGMTVKKTGKLADRIELAVGMRAMVLMNIATEADLANGTRGEIVDIKLDSREPADMAIDKETGATILQYPPVLVLFKPDQCSFPAFEGLPKGVLPIVPSKMTFSIQSPGQKTCRIQRRQLAMTPAYAFTDYKSQGQTIGYVFVDLAKPPTGKLTPFSAYVVLSRSRGRASIRLLRDFDDALFTTHPSDELASEDKRLDLLSVQTRIMYA